MNKDERLSRRWLPLILLFGTPPTKPDDPDVEHFADFIHDLAIWTNNCREQYMKWEGIPDDYEWYKHRNTHARRMFDVEFITWAYNLGPEEYPKEVV